MLKRSGRVKFSSLGDEFQWLSPCNACLWISIWAVLNSGWGSSDCNSGGNFLWPLNDKNYFLWYSATLRNLGPQSRGGSHLALGSNAVVPRRCRSGRDLGWQKGWIIVEILYQERRRVTVLGKIFWQWDVLSWVGGGQLLLCRIHHQNIFITLLSKVLYKF